MATTLMSAAEREGVRWGGVSDLQRKVKEGYTDSQKLALRESTNK